MPVDAAFDEMQDLSVLPDCHGILGASCPPTARGSGTRGSSVSLNSAAGVRAS